MHHKSKVGNWDRLPAYSKREGQPSQRAVGHVLNSLDFIYIYIYLIFQSRQEADVA